MPPLASQILLSFLLLHCTHIKKKTLKFLFFYVSLYFYFLFVVGWRSPLKDSHILNPGICEWIFPYVATKEFFRCDCVKNIEMKRLFWVIQWILITILCVFIRERLVESRYTQTEKEATSPSRHRLEWFSWQPPETRKMYLKYYI